MKKIGIFMVILALVSLIMGTVACSWKSTGPPSVDLMEEARKP